jgi:hypothetical protein
MNLLPATIYSYATSFFWPWWRFNGLIGHAEHVVHDAMRDLYGIPFAHFLRFSQCGQPARIAALMPAKIQSSPLPVFEIYRCLPSVRDAQVLAMLEKSASAIPSFYGFPYLR